MDVGLAGPTVGEVTDHRADDGESPGFPYDPPEPSDMHYKPDVITACFDPTQLVTKVSPRLSLGLWSVPFL